MHYGSMMSSFENSKRRSLKNLDICWFEYLDMKTCAMWEDVRLFTEIDSYGKGYKP